MTVAEYKLLEHDDKIDRLFNALETRNIENEKIFFVIVPLYDIILPEVIPI